MYVFRFSIRAGLSIWSIVYWLIKHALNSACEAPRIIQKRPTLSGLSHIFFMWCNKKITKKTHQTQSFQTAAGQALRHVEQNRFVRGVTSFFLVMWFVFSAASSFASRRHSQQHLYYPHTRREDITLETDTLRGRNQFGELQNNASRGRRPAVFVDLFVVTILISSNRNTDGLFT